MTENQLNNQYTDEQEIDIMEMISKLWKKRTMIIKWCVVGAVIGLIVGFSIPKTYTASTLLAPESSAAKGTGNLSSLASIAGISLGSSSIDAINVDMYPDVVHSTPFIVDLLDLNVEFERNDSTVNTTLLDYMLNYQQSPWWSSLLRLPSNMLKWIKSIGDSKEYLTDNLRKQLEVNNLPKNVREVVKFFSENIVISVDKKTGKTSISLQLQDPRVVYVVVNAIVDNLVEYMSDYRSSKARQDVLNLSAICEERKSDYYNAQQAYATFVDSNKSVVRQSAQAELERLQQEMNLAYQVYSQVSTNLEAARIQEQQSKPVFVIINPVSVPIKRTAPSKSKLLIIFTFLAGCSAVTWTLFGEDYWNRLKENL